MAAGASGVPAMHLHPLPERCRRRFPFVLLQFGNVGRRWRWRLAEELFQYPATTLDGRRACGVRGGGEDARLREQAATRAVGGRDAMEVLPLAAGLAVGVFQAVVLRQRRVDERGVRIDQFQDAAILVKHAPYEEFGLLEHGGPQVVVERGKEFAVG